MRRFVLLLSYASKFPLCNFWLKNKARLDSVLDQVQVYGSFEMKVSFVQLKGKVSLVQVINASIKQNFPLCNIYF